MKLEIKKYLDELVDKYETSEFIVDDPIQFSHKYTCKSDIEIVAFLSTIFAYGKRELFISKLNELFSIMGDSPTNFVLNFTDKNNVLDNFNYRFSVGVDLVQIILILKVLYANGDSLESLFAYGWQETKSIQGMLQVVVDYFYFRVKLPVTKGFYHLLPNPRKNSACKRLNMFLRWLVRDGVVDLGLWSFIPKSELLIPLDVHVARVSRELGLLTRSQNDFRAVVMLTEELKSLDADDPVKYDFAIFGYGVNN